MNVDLWKELDNLSSKFNISWNWVKGHDGNVFNERCDILCSDELDRRCSLAGKNLNEASFIRSLEKKRR